MTDCDICYEATNKTKKKLINCPYCKCNLCSPCLRKYLLEDVSPEPKCPSCKAVYNRHILLSMFPTTFLTKDYKLHREKVLLDAEKSKLPEAQVYAEKYIEAKKYLDDFNKKKLEKEILMKDSTEYEDLQQAQKEYNEFYEKHRGTIFSNETFMAQYRILTKNIQDAKIALHKSDEHKEFRKVSHYPAGHYNKTETVRTYGKYVPPTFRRNADGILVEDKKPKERERHFIKACPMKDCRGFLSTAYKCGLCNSHICKDCNEQKKEHKDDDHVCDPDKVSSVKLIASETTPCPKCAIPIFKVSGCDQIWCTNCHTAFNHKTGVIETGVIHNPHYFEWMRKNGQAIPGNANAIIQDACGGNNWRIENILVAREAAASKTKHENHKYFKVLLDRYVFINHTIATTRNYLVSSVRGFESIEKKDKLKVLYLTKEIDEKKWKYLLQRDEKGAAREKAKLQLLEMFIGAARQIYDEVITNPSYDPIKMVTALNDLMLFVNEQSKYLLKDYQNTTPGCDYNWNDTMWNYIPCKKEKKKYTKKTSVISHVKDDDLVEDDAELSDSDSELSDSESDSSDKKLTPKGGAGL